MIAQRFLVPLLLLVQPALAGDPPPTLNAKAFNPFDVVGICAVPSDGRPWSVVWHPAAQGSEEKAMRVFRHLEAPDVDACLVLIIEADEDTYALVQGFAKNPTYESTHKAIDAARRRWTLYGVDRAIREVAESGRRGAEVARLLAACEGIRVPKEIGGDDRGKE